MNRNRFVSLLRAATVAALVLCASLAHALEVAPGEPATYRSGTLRLVKSGDGGALVTAGDGSFTEGNLAAFDGAGNVVDSGISDGNLTASHVAAENCDLLQSGPDGLVSCRVPDAPPAFTGAVFTNATPNLQPYSVVTLNGNTAGEVIEAPAGALNVLGCAQNSTTLAAGQPVFVIWQGEATCRSGIQLANEFVGIDSDNAGMMKTVTLTARLKRLGFRLDGNLLGPGTFYLFGHGWSQPTVIFPAAFSAQITSAEQFFPITGITTSAPGSRTAAELNVGAGAIGQVKCHLSNTPPATLTVRLYKNATVATSCTMSTSQTSCSMKSIDEITTATDRVSLSVQLASSTDDDDLTCTIPFTPTL